MKKINIKNSDYRGINKINRESYSVLEFCWSDFLENEKREIFKEANLLYKNSSIISANTGINRTDEKKYIDTLSGIIAEFAVVKFFNEFLNYNYEAIRPLAISSNNQIDILLKYKSQTYKVEVRSSFVKNGLNFALFAIDKKNGKTYFDILGTYKQSIYKKDFESIKDLFMRVFFDINTEDYNKFYNDKKYFIDKYINRNEPFYIIGGMSGKKIINQNYTKNLCSYEINNYNIIPGIYHVSEISKISDIDKFINS